jgi:hypothetical protein
MIINDLDIRGPRRPSGPLEADPPLVIDPNAVLSLSVALQGFKSVTRQSTKILKLNSRFQAIQL